jgi:anaerobic magnesium-protoporphyrin IX monomethyl ester cyclase
LKLILATAPCDLGERYGSFRGAGSSIPNLGLLSLAAVVRAAGHEIRVVDAAAGGMNRAQFLREVARFAPDVIGFSATTSEVYHAAATSEDVKRLVPRVRIVLGGAHVSAVPEETLQRFPIFDVAVIGEGETTLVDLLDVMRVGGDLSRVNGLVFRASGRLARTQRRVYIADLDRLPMPAWDLLPGFPNHFAPAAFKTRKLPVASLVTSRGCPNRCIFCDRSVFGSSCHAFSADQVVRMVRHLYDNHGVRELSFEDDTFVTFKRRLAAICEKLIELGPAISWSCLGRVNDVTAKSLSLMRQAGCWQVSFGIESGSQRILNAIRKNVTVEQIREAVEATREAGLLAKGFFMVGHPGETKETLRETTDLALALPLNDISVSMLTPFPGTELFARATELGTFEPDWTKMNLLNVVFVPHGLTAGDLEAAQRELIRRFYLRPRIVAGYVERLARNPAILPSVWNGFRAFVRSV